jgi:hypothetical protein
MALCLLSCQMEVAYCASTFPFPMSTALLVIHYSRRHRCYLVRRHRCTSHSTLGRIRIRRLRSPVCLRRRA